MTATTVGLIMAAASASWGFAADGTGRDFAEHVRMCQHHMGFDGTMNPGMHQGFSNWDPDHTCE